MVSTTVGTTVTNSTAVSFTSLLLSHISNSKKRFNEIAIGCGSGSWIGMNSAHDNQGDYLSVTPILLQKCLLPHQYAKRMSSSAPMAVASALSFAATTSTTARTMVLMKSTAI